jgi:hypothetical protein
VANALRHRSLAFAVVGAYAIVLLAWVAPVLDVVPATSHPDLATWILLAATSVQGLLLAWLARPGRVAGQLLRARRPPSLERAGRSLAWTAATFAAVPVTVGLALLAASGDVWRFLVFQPTAALVGVLLWRRVGQAVEELARRGVT